MSPNALISAISSIGTQLAGVTLICYLLGVFTINSYLYATGFSDFLSTLNFRFVYAGVIVLSTLAFSTIFPIAAYMDKRPGMPTRVGKSIAAFIFTSLVYLGINFFFVYFCADHQSYFLFIDPVNPCRDESYTRNIVIQFSVCSSLVGLICGFILINLKAKDVPEKSFKSLLILPRSAYKEAKKGLEPSVSQTLLILLLIPILSFYITFVGKRVYPLIPEQYGGGLPKLAQILFDKSHIRLKELGIEINDQGLSIEGKQKIAIIFETGSSYLLSVYHSVGNTKEVILVDKKLVKGVKIKPLLRVPEFIWLFDNA